MTTLKSSSQASTYYSKDNYYTKEPTAESLEKAEWYGKGAEVLGLVDQDLDPVFQYLCLAVFDLPAALFWC